ncbi:nitric oxide synthase [Nocardia panacis]|uniref:Nitric oxide synthase n=1 Tax=Nocardia panacis TaxID=2340916 RepID=A0A3A4K5J6_9NOCA|nr:flavodoxin domain-containing protein [Nocardia panacis]RJO75881.1 nitric oxide synthase [Nocardia panacis]
MRVVILFGTELGTAESVAETLAATLTDHDVHVRDMSEFAAAELDSRDIHLIVCSTYGSGDLPTGAEPFFAELDTLAPDLTGLRFAVFGLGDTVYGDTFNRGGEIAAAKLSARGAEQFGEHARHDASSTIRARDAAREWVAHLPIPRLASA